jgi:CheY-like chemotaxis protein
MVAELTPEVESRKAGDNRPKRVLVVDDDQDQVLALRHRLEKLGYEVVTAHTGRRAVAAAREKIPDVVLLDLRLPDATGFEVCEDLADSPNTCGTPIIILSAMEGPDIVRQARRVGCEFYVRKPYDPNVLLTLIEHALQQERDWDT